MELLITLAVLVLLYGTLLYTHFKNKILWFLLLFLTMEGLYFMGWPGLSRVFSVILIAQVIIAFTPLLGMLIVAFTRTKLGKRILSVQISDRERTALLSGDTWVEKDIFSGSPNMRQILATPSASLSAAEQAFLKGPAQRACEMANDYKITEDRDLPPALWAFLRKNKFFGMIIPKKYGGLEFSAEAQSRIVQKLASRSYGVAVTVMVPNSLGPAELLLKYGSKRQKDRYLSKLAVGKLLPCFALTEPMAGSDASSISASGVLEKNKKTGALQIRLNWRKRYITLAAVADILGLAFKLRDPNHLFSDKENLGITCALIPTQTKGVVLGRRHDPMGVPFFNCPTEGKDVIVGIEQIIGEEKGIGEGWKMLMECLAAGRGISIPALLGGGSKLTLEAMGTYGYVRRQFGLPIYKFEGVAEKIAPTIGMTYIIEAARRFTTTSIDQGLAAPIVSAIMKYHTSELARTIINDGMDILGGAGISRGKRNLLASAYLALPISITVEGANILTRSFIIFGQGLFRCHPHLFPEFDALAGKDSRALARHMRGHILRVLHLKVRAVVMFITRGYSAVQTWWRPRPLGGYERKLLWASSMLALIAEGAIFFKGGGLKTSEMLNGKIGDILSWIYLLTATLHRYKEEGMKKSDRAVFAYAMQEGLHRLQQSTEDAMRSLLLPIGLGELYARIFSLNPYAAPPCDGKKLGVTRHVVENAAHREALTDGIFVPTQASEQVQRLRKAYAAAQYHDKIKAKLQREMTKRRLPVSRRSISDNLPLALKEKLLTPAEVKKIKEALALMQDAIEVDSYTLRDYKAHKA